MLPTDQPPMMGAELSGIIFYIPCAVLSFMCFYVRGELRPRSINDFTQINPIVMPLVLVNAIFLFIHQSLGLAPWLFLLFLPIASAIVWFVLCRLEELYVNGPFGNLKTSVYTLLATLGCLIVFLGLIVIIKGPVWYGSIIACGLGILGGWLRLNAFHEKLTPGIASLRASLGMDNGSSTAPSEYMNTLYYSFLIVLIPLFPIFSWISHPEAFEEAIAQCTFGFAAGVVGYVTCCPGYDWWRLNWKSI